MGHHLWHKLLHCTNRGGVVQGRPIGHLPLQPKIRGTAPFNRPRESQLEECSQLNSKELNWKSVHQARSKAEKALATVKAKWVTFRLGTARRC